MEACPLSEWLHTNLVKAGFKAVCVEMRDAQRFLSTRPVKTDRNDARGIAEMMRVGHYRPVHVKSSEAQLVRTILQARRQIVGSLLQIQGSIRGLLKVYGLKVGETHRSQFDKRVRELLTEIPKLEMAIGPLLRVLEQLVGERKKMDKLLGDAARKDKVCLRLMTILGVGPITSLAFRATVDEPDRFATSKSVGEHPGHDAKDLSVRRGGPIRTDQQAGRRHAPPPAVRSGIRTDDALPAAVEVAGVGRCHREATWIQARPGRCGAQARGDHAPHVGVRDAVRDRRREAGAGRRVAGAGFRSTRSTAAWTTGAASPTRSLRTP